jgi:protein TonB
MRGLILLIATFSASATAQINFGSRAGSQQMGLVYSPEPGITDPVAIDKPEPQYSEEARQAKLEGSVMLEVVVDEEGRVRSAKVLRPLRPMELGLNEMAVMAAIKWKFKPGMKDGKAVAVATQIEIPFRLPEK